MTITLHRSLLPQPTEFAGVFAEFREKVESLADASDKAALLNGPDSANYKLAAEFLQGYKASTDLTPRVKRLQALVSFIREKKG